MKKLLALFLKTLLIENSSARNIKVYERFRIRDRVFKN